MLCKISEQHSIITFVPKRIYSSKFLYYDSFLKLRLSWYKVIIFFLTFNNCHIVIGNITIGT